MTDYISVWINQLEKYRFITSNDEREECLKFLELECKVLNTDYLNYLITLFFKNIKGKSSKIENKINYFINTIVKNENRYNLKLRFIVKSIEDKTL